MNRRDILKNLTLITGGAMILPACDLFEEKVAISLNNLKVTEKQNALLNEVVGILIPNGEIPGAKELKVQNFVWVMVDDLMEKTDQDRFMSGLDQFNGFSRKVAGRTFSKLSTEQKTNLLKEILIDESTMATSAQKNTADIRFCINSIKQLTMQGYMYSKYIMTEVMPYALIPGAYEPCKPIDHLKRVNIHG